MRNTKMNLFYISTVFFLLSSLMIFAQEKSILTPVNELDGREDPRELEKVVAGMVEVTLGTDMWDGEDVVPENVTPIQVTIDNANEKPIVINYNKFALVNTDGEKYYPMPLYAVDLEMKQLIMDKDFEMFPKPIYEYDNYFLYPIYDPVYTGVEFTQYAYEIDPEIQAKFIDWDTMDADLPTQEMRTKALPEGVLDIDGIVSGFLYFEQVDPNDDKVTFMFDIVDAETGEKIDTALLQYYVMNE